MAVAAQECLQAALRDGWQRFARDSAASRSGTANAVKAARDGSSSRICSVSPQSLRSISVVTLWGKSAQHLLKLVRVARRHAATVEMQRASTDRPPRTRRFAA